jgi:hypothetical protein
MDQANRAGHPAILQPMPQFQGTALPLAAARPTDVPFAVAA